MSEKRSRGRPRVEPDQKAKSYAVKLKPDEIERIKAKADAHGVSQARLITLAVDAYPSAPLPGDEL